jgi:hypothetical protein
MYVMLRYVLCNAILFTTMLSSQHQAAMDVVPPAELYNPAIAYIGTFTHARTLMLLGRRCKPSPAHT